MWLSWVRHSVPGFQARPYAALAAAVLLVVYGLGLSGVTRRRPGG